VRYYAVQIANGKWMSRARFDPSWDGAFQLKHPELFDSLEAAVAAADGEDQPIVVAFEIVSS
jgi:hypothetical protein